jgi:hypothetical protein
MIQHTIALLLVLFFVATHCSIFDYSVIDANGNSVSLEKYKSAKAILIGTRQHLALLLQQVFNSVTKYQ